MDMQPEVLVLLQRHVAGDPRIDPSGNDGPSGLLAVQSDLHLRRGASVIS
jgi:hypothetical protein